MSVLPMNAPRYAVYMMLDEPKANASTHGYATAGWVAAPSAGRVIARIGPMLGVFPETDNAAAVQASLAIPLQPGRPPGASATVKPAAPMAAAPVSPTKKSAPVAQGHQAQRPATPPGLPPAGAIPAVATPLQGLRQDVKLRASVDEGH
jgi:cell division protein FtsI (penicillin-binding protein 3)